MIVVMVFAVLLALVLLGTGVLLLTPEKWLSKLTGDLPLKFAALSSMARISIWKLRALGILQIVMSVFILISLLFTSAGPSLPFIVPFIPLAAYALLVLLGWIMQVVMFMRKKLGSKKQ